VLQSLSPGQAVIEVVNEELTELMGKANVALNLAAVPPAIILMAGLQGSGKTTTLPNWQNYSKNKRKKYYWPVPMCIAQPRLPSCKR
jgi:signal recognition particle subunit SRP54